MDELKSSVLDVFCWPFPILILLAVRKIIKKPSLQYTAVVGEEVGSHCLPNGDHDLNPLAVRCGNQEDGKPWNTTELAYLVKVRALRFSYLNAEILHYYRTKSVTRYHTPEVKKKIQERAQYKEALNKESCKAFALFLDEIAQNHYGIMRAAVNNLAIADCLLSLAHVALQEGYVRPEFTEDDTLEIVQGLHSFI